MELRTHLGIDASLVGTPEILGEGRARAVLRTAAAMAADDRGLVHGGFVFGLVDLAAMAAVNDPNVVLGAADVQFVAPVRVGDEVVAEATVREAQGRKRQVAVTARVGETTVVTGTLLAFVLDRHVLDGR
ncbi:MAG: MaoC/PaaZ C-terminal domain-containing protein [Myxococcota bacterium]